MVRWLGLLAGLLVLSVSNPAAAATCQAWGTLDEDPAAILGEEARWHCGEFKPDIGPERALIRYDIEPGSLAPTHFVSRRSALAAIHLAVIGTDGSLRIARHTIDDQRQAAIDGFVSLPLPTLSAQTRSVVAVVDRPTTPIVLQRSYLSVGDPLDGEKARRDLMLMAFICGMLLMPLVFNSVFYRILQQRFLIWHSVHVAVMIGSVTFSSGLVVWLVDIPMSWVSTGATLGFGFMVATGTMFARYFIEDGKLHPWLRRAMPWTALLAASASALHAAFPYVLRPIQLDLYMIAFLPVLLVLLLVMADALRRRSEAMLYQMVAWGPLLLMGVARQFSYLVPGLTPTDAMTLFYFGCAFEVFATAMGVANRMMTLRRQRDNALEEARALGDLSERDALTGLFNRRAIEDRFALLRAEGFTTMAVIDLDLFKGVNDTYGHAVGDEVLRSAAAALQPEENVLAIRMGGEEFLLLLRGTKAREMAEQRRKAITLRVAEDVTLDRLVTASMGLVEAPRDAAPKLDFAALYSHADRLLYEAKATGRNRTVSERMRVFRPRKTERRVAA